MHQAVETFEKALNNDKGEMAPSTAANFRRWLEKQTEPEVVAKGNELLAQYESKKDRLAPRGGGPQAPHHGGNRGHQGGRGGYGGGGGRGPQRGGGYGGHGGGGHGQGMGGQGGPPRRIDNAEGGDPEVLEEPFHNPYTFLSFPEQPPVRKAPTPLTIDEEETDRFTGVLDLDIELLSPLLTNNPEHVSEEQGHKTYRALTIGDDVIVPATGVRGALRSLMTIIAGGTLSHIDEEAWLCQGRDAQLGPASKFTHGKSPEHVFLAQVEKPGGIGRNGTLRLGNTKLIQADDLDRLAQRRGIGRLPRPEGGKRTQYLWTDDDVTSLSRESDGKHRWKIKLSGRPINPRGKREGLFLAGEKTIDVPMTLWSAYLGRNRHGEHPELKKGDLVWLEPTDLNLSEITRGDQIKSIQWARWGREGERLLDVIARDHRGYLPDAINPDGLVDEVTDLFGQVARDDLTKEVEAFRKYSEQGLPGPAGPFAGRIRPCNLVFANARDKVQKTTLAPLAPPHPGCAAFYRKPNEAHLGAAADRISNHKMPIRGFKVYRTTRERGDQAPWHFKNQGVYDEHGRPKGERQKVNKTVDLLPETTGVTGRLRITVRALSQRELALLLGACTADWRLGGGKPLGLGHCRVRSLTLHQFEDSGELQKTLSTHRNGDEALVLPDPHAAQFAREPRWTQGLHCWQASQQPVARLRYPRGAISNRNKINMGGHVWFGRHAQPRKTVRDERYPVGLQTLHLGGQLERDARSGHLRAQPLPLFDSDHPFSDCLYGYDLYLGEGEDWAFQTRNRETHVCKFEPFDPTRHASGKERSGGRQGMNRDRRQDHRKQR